MQKSKLIWYRTSDDQKLNIYLLLLHLSGIISDLLYPVRCATHPLHMKSPSPVIQRLRSDHSTLRTIADYAARSARYKAGPPGAPLKIRGDSIMPEGRRYLTCFGRQKSSKRELTNLWRNVNGPSYPFRSQPTCPMSRYWPGATRLNQTPTTSYGGHQDSLSPLRSTRNDAITERRRDVLC